MLFLQGRASWPFLVVGSSAQFEPRRVNGHRLGLAAVVCQFDSGKDASRLQPFAEISLTGRDGF